MTRNDRENQTRMQSADTMLNPGDEAARGPPAPARTFARGATAAVVSTASCVRTAAVAALSSEALAAADWPPINLERFQQARGSRTRLSTGRGQMCLEEKPSPACVL
jgi:hypothetical protein